MSPFDDQPAERLDDVWTLPDDPDVEGPVAWPLEPHDPDLA